MWHKHKKDIRLNLNNNRYSNKVLSELNITDHKRGKGMKPKEKVPEDNNTLSIRYGDKS